MSVRVVNMRAKVPADAIVVNTTSRSAVEWSRGLSPFYLGPVELYGGRIAESVENAWQYAKVYAAHVDAAGDPTAAYQLWAEAGWKSDKAVRYPMGKGARPEYSFWNGEKLGYIDARKHIYCPLYARAVEGTAAFAELRRIYLECVSSGKTLYLRDFDGYNQGGATYTEVLNDPTRKMGHAFVLAMMLVGYRAWEI